MARRKGDERPDDTSPAPSELGELHCCSVADVRLSPASDRIAAHSADSGLCHRRTLGFSSQLVRASGFWSARRSIPEYRKFVDHELESIGAAPRKA